jgi:GT2 family glycosyltransferase
MAVPHPVGFSSTFPIGIADGRFQSFLMIDRTRNVSGGPDEDRLVIEPSRMHEEESHERPRLTIVIVNYNSWPDIVRLASSLQQEPEFPSGAFEVVVVDNASHGPVPQQFSPPLPRGLRLLLRPENGGFAAGVNAGWRLARSPWLLVLNPDVDVERGWIDQVFKRIDFYERRPAGPPGLVGFGLRNPDGSPQGSVGVFPSLGRTIREQFIPRSRRKYQADWRIRRGPVDWVTGACMLIHAGMIAELRGMDEDFFLYHEEVAFSRSAQHRGWLVEFDPAVEVVHRHPLQNRPISPKMRVIIRHSKLLYFRKHLPRWQFLAMSWIMTAEARGRGLLAACRGCVPERLAWRAIREITARMRSGELVRGNEVHRLATQTERVMKSRSTSLIGPHRSPDRGTNEEVRGGVGTAVPASSPEQSKA